MPAIGVCVSMAKQQCEKVADSLYVTLSCYYHQGCKTTTTATITSKKVLPCSGLYKVKSPFADQEYPSHKIFNLLSTN